MFPSAPPRTLAKPPKAPLRGQGPSGAPPQSQDDTIKAIAMQQAQAAQPAPARAQPAPVPVRYSSAPAPAPVLAPASPYAQQPPAKAAAPQQQMAPDPRAQAIDAMKAKTGGGDYPNPEWQPQPAYLKTTEPYTPAPVGNVVPASTAPAPVIYNPSVPSAAPVLAKVTQSQYEPERKAADMFVPNSPVAMNPNYDPNKPHSGKPDLTDLIIGPDRQELVPPAQDEPTKKIDPTSSIDWSPFDKSKNPGPGWDWDGETGVWHEVPMPEGISKDSPGWVYGEDGWQHDPMAAVKEKVALSASEVMDKDLSEFGFNAEELQAQEDQIIRQAAEAKAKAAQQMAGRGLGGSGLEIAGFGNIDVGALSAITDLKTENKALQIEQRLNEIKTYLSAYGSQLDDETRNALAAEAMDLQKTQLDYEKGEQKESDRHTTLNNLIAQLGGEQWDADALAWAYDQLDAGASYSDVVREMFTGSDKDVTVSPSVLKAAEEADASEAGSEGGGASSGSSGLAGVAEPVPYAGEWMWQWPQAQGPNKNTHPGDPNWMASWNDYREYAESTGQGFMSFPEFQDYWYSTLDGEQ